MHSLALPRVNAAHRENLPALTRGGIAASRVGPVGSVARAQWGNGTITVEDAVVCNHAHGVVVVDVTDDLPLADTSCRHDQSVHLTVVDAYGRYLSVLSVNVCVKMGKLTCRGHGDAILGEAVAVHMEDVRARSVSIGVPKNIVIATHLEERVVSKDVAIHAVEGWSIAMSRRQ